MRLLSWTYVNDGILDHIYNEQSVKFGEDDAAIAQDARQRGVA